jgi:hypothetical protein
LDLPARPAKTHRPGDVSLDNRDDANACPHERVGLFADDPELVTRVLVNG